MVTSEKYLGSDLLESNISLFCAHLSLLNSLELGSPNNNLSWGVFIILFTELITGAELSKQASFKGHLYFSCY